MRSFSKVLDEIQSCLSYYPVISFAVILGLSVNFIFSLDFYYKETLEIVVIPWIPSVKKHILHSGFALIFLVAQLYLAYKYLKIVIALGKYTKGFGKYNITLTTDLKNFLRVEMFNRFIFRLFAITLCLVIIFSKSIFLSCEDIWSMCLVDTTHYIYVFIILLVFSLIEYPTFRLLMVYSKYLYEPTTSGEYVIIWQRVMYFFCDMLSLLARSTAKADKILIGIFMLLGLSVWAFFVMLIKQR